MFVGFIAVIVILILITGYMSQGTTTGSEDKAEYYTQAHKVKIMISNIKGEALFYYQGNNESYKDINATYFKNVGFSDSLFDSGTMTASDWKGLSTDYTGSYIKVNGPAKDNMRIIINETTTGNGYYISLIGKNTDGDDLVDNVDPAFPSILESVMRSDVAFLGG